MILLSEIKLTIENFLQVKMCTKIANFFATLMCWLSHAKHY